MERGIVEAKGKHRADPADEPEFPNFGYVRGRCHGNAAKDGRNIRNAGMKNNGWSYRSGEIAWTNISLVRPPTNVWTIFPPASTINVVGMPTMFPNAASRSSLDMRIG